MSTLDPVLRAMRLQRGSHVCDCPVCGRSVTDRDERLRLRGRTFVHRRCASYRVRQLSRPRATTGVR